MKRAGKVSVPVARAIETRLVFLIAARTRSLEWLTQIDILPALCVGFHPASPTLQVNSLTLPDEAQAVAGAVGCGAARADAVTRKSGEMGNLHRRPKTRPPLFWCSRKGRGSIITHLIKKERMTQAKGVADASHAFCALPQSMVQ